MPVHERGAQRASSHRTRSCGWPCSVSPRPSRSASAVTPAPAAAATATGMKVVIVVGPVGGSTSNYIYNAKRLRQQARSYGATVTEIYSPNATWSKVKSAAQGANVLIYLGHGNGYPSPYGAFSAYTKDGHGPQRARPARATATTSITASTTSTTYIQLAPNAVVILNRLCYASGNSEPGSRQPDQVVAPCSGSTTSGPASCGPARRPSSPIGIASASYTLKSCSDGSDDHVLRRSGTTRRGTCTTTSRSTRRAPRGCRVWMDPSSPGRYYRSLVGNLSLTTATVSAAADSNGRRALARQTQLSPALLDRRPRTVGSVVWSPARRRGKDERRAPRPRSRSRRASRNTVRTPEQLAEDAGEQHRGDARARTSTPAGSP